MNTGLNKHTQMKKLDEMLEVESNYPNCCKPVLDNDVIQAEYDTCLASSDIERAKKLYNITKVRPSDEKMTQPVKTALRAVLPVTIDYKENAACSQDSGFVDDLLKEYKPCLEMPICASGAPGLFEQEKRKPMTSAKDLCNLMIQKIGNMEPGNRYTWEIPIYQGVNILNQPLSFPYLDTKVEPKVSKII